MRFFEWWQAVLISLSWAASPSWAQADKDHAILNQAIVVHSGQTAHAISSQSVTIRYPRHGVATGWLLWGTGYPFAWSPTYVAPFPFYTSPFPYAAPVAVAPQVNVPAPRPADPVQEDRPAKAKPKATNAESKAKAGRYIGFGDANFAKQKYLAAITRYRTAAEMAPDLAEPYFRQGYALVALGQFDNATKAFRRGLKIRSDWSDSDFRLDKIYGADQLAKTAHLENLAKAVESNPLDSDALVALGMQLYFDGQRERAAAFFARAAQLGGNEDRLLNDFVPKPGPAGAPKAQANAKAVF